MWAGFDPRAEPLDIEVVREWTEHGADYRELWFTGMSHEGSKVRVYAIYSAPIGGKDLPAVLHIHGGGQTVAPHWLRFWNERGYAALTFNYLGRWPGREKYTDWGKLKQGNHLDSGPMLMATEPRDGGVRQSSWYLWTRISRRALTVLENQPQVDPARLGIFGISMGGVIVWPMAAIDNRVKAACAIYGVGWDTYPRDTTANDPHADNPAMQLWRTTMVPQAYAPLVTCPMLFLNATNDQLGNIDRTDATLGLVPSPVRAAYTPRYRHHVANEEGRNLPLWMDTWLKDQPIVWPVTPALRVELDDRGVPRLVLDVDHPDQAEAVEIYYGLENRDPISRYWRSAPARREGSQGWWIAPAPVMDIDQPLYAFANVRYRSGVCLSSNLATAVPSRLGPAVATDQRDPLISECDDALDGWITSSIGTDPVGSLTPLIHLAQGPDGRKGVTVQRPIALYNYRLGDPKWRAPAPEAPGGSGGSTLCFDVYAQAPRSLKVTLHEQEFTNEWKKYSKTFDLQPSEGWQTMQLQSRDVVTEDGGPLRDWSSLQVIELNCIEAPGGGPEPIYARFRWENY